MLLKNASLRPAFAGMEGHFSDVVAPYLAAREADRRNVVAIYFAVLGVFAAVVIALLVARPFYEASLQVAFFVGAVGAAASTWLLRRGRRDISHGLLQRVCSGIGFGYVGDPGRPTYFGDFERLNLIPSFNRESWEDEVHGAHDGASFVFCEAHLKRKTSNGKSSSVRTVFHGQLFVIDYPRPFLGETVIRRDEGVFNRFGKPGPAFAQVGLASSEFEKAFEAWSTDQVEGRTLLDPVVLERFQELERLYSGRKLRAAFTGGKLLIAVETGDALNMGSMFRRLDDPARVDVLLAEFDGIFDLIDVLLKRASRPMDGPITAAALRNA